MRHLIVACALVPGFFAAQNRWDLSSCIEYAVKHNISLRQTELNNEVNKNNLVQAEAAVLPTLNGGATHVYNFGQTIDRFTNQFASKQVVLSQNFFLSSSVVLWSGMGQYNNIKANEYNYLSGVERLKQQENDLSLNVANAYIGVIFSDELLKISVNQLAVSQEQLDRTLKLVEAGSAAKSVEYDMRAQLATDQLNVTTAENNYQISLLTLRQLMNLDTVSSFEVVRPDIEVPATNLMVDNDVNYIYEMSLKSQPTIRSGEYSILSAERRLAVSRGRISPSLSFNASLGTGTSGLSKKILGYNTVKDTLAQIPNYGPILYDNRIPITQKTPFAEQFRNNANQSIGFSLTIPLFNGLQTHTAIKNAKIAAYNAKLSQDLTKQNLYKNIAQAYANAKAALNKYNSSKASVEAANESFKYAQQKFTAGAISGIDFSTAKNRLFAAESNMLQAKYDYVFKLKVLDYYQGKPLGF